MTDPFRVRTSTSSEIVSDDDDPPLDNVTFFIRYLRALGELTVEDLAAGRWPGRCLLGACRNLLHHPRTESHRR